MSWQILHKRSVILILLTMPIFFIGIGNRFPWVLLGTHGIDIGVTFFFCITVGFYLALLIKLENLLSIECLQKCFCVQLVISQLLVLFYDILNYKHFAKLGYHKPIALYVLDVIWIVYIILVNRKIANQTSHYFTVITGFILLHCLGNMYYFPLNPARSDMLPAINLAIVQFMHHLSPYQQIMPNIGIPPYLPITILSFVPATILHVDLRFIGLLYTWLLLYLLNKQLPKLSTLNQLTICLVVLNPYWLMRHDLYFQLFLVEICLLVLYIPKYHEIFRTLIIGISFATLQFAIIICPFILLGCSKNIYQLIRQTLGSIFIATMIIAWFTHRHFTDFYSALFVHREYLHPYSSDITFGISPVFHFAKNQLVMYIAQIIGCISIFAYALYQHVIKHNYDSKLYYSIAGLCYLYFMSTNYFLETYLLTPMLLFLSITNV